MKIKPPLLIPVIAIFAQCERTECCVNPTIELQGRFTQKLPICDNGDSPEVNCIEWLEFINGKEVDFSYGRLDTIRSYSYIIKDRDILYLQGGPTSSFKGIFRIIDSKTLVRLDTEDIWKKEE